MTDTRVVTSGLRFPEGPIALPNGDVLVVEVAAGLLTRVAPDGGRSVVANTGGGPNGAAIGPDGACYICNNGGIAVQNVEGILIPQETPATTQPGLIQRVDLDSGAVASLYEPTQDAPFWGPNDLVFDRHGGFWFTDYGRTQGRSQQRGSVYYAKSDGSFIEEVLHPMECPNGIGLSPDGTTLYVAETFTSHLWQFKLTAPGRIDHTAGAMPNGGTILGRAGAGQFLDSLAVDGEGYVCVASPGAGAILVWSPDGNVQEQIPMPDFLTTNICFGGHDLQTAYITLGSSGRLVAMPWPRPGLRLNGA